MQLVQNVQGNTPLHWAAENGQLAAAKLLLLAPDVDVLIVNSFGKSAFTVALLRGFYEVHAEVCSSQSFFHD